MGIRWNFSSVWGTARWIFRNLLLIIKLSTHYKLIESSVWLTLKRNENPGSNSARSTPGFSGNVLASDLLLVLGNSLRKDSPERMIRTTRKKLEQWFHLKKSQKQPLNGSSTLTIECYKVRRRFEEWRTGEVTTIGTLRCRHCGELVRFKRTGRIPPCPKCRATVYERVRS